jgi:hypothetical protein
MTALRTTFGLIALAALSQAAIIIGGPPDPATGNCFPFGCSGGTRYQQVYNAAEFGGPTLITSITFYNTQYFPGSVAPGTYDFYLSTTSKPVDGLDTVMSNNVGGDNAHFALYVGGGSAFPSFTVSGTGFAYDPANGNLLVDIFVSNAGGGTVFLDARNGSGTGATSRMHDFGCCFEGWGLVTGFNVTVVPEPSTYATFAAGLAGLAFLRRRR